MRIVRRARVKAQRVLSAQTPNFASPLPVEILSCPPAPTSGFTRMAIGGLCLPSRRGDRATALQFGDAFDIDLVHAGSHARTPVRRLVLPTPEKMIRSAGTPAFSARSISPRLTVSAPAPFARQRRQHGNVGVGLHRKRDQHIARRERALEHLVVPLKRRGGIDVGRRADRLGDCQPAARLRSRARRRDTRNGSRRRAAAPV